MRVEELWLVVVDDMNQFYSDYEEAYDAIHNHLTDVRNDADFDVNDLSSYIFSVDLNSLDSF